MCVCVKANISDLFQSLTPSLVFGLVTGHTPRWEETIREKLLSGHQQVCVCVCVWLFHLTPFTSKSKLVFNILLLFLGLSKIQLGV